MELPPAATDAGMEAAGAERLSSVSEEACGVDAAGVTPAAPPAAPLGPGAVVTGDVAAPADPLAPAAAPAPAGAPAPAAAPAKNTGCASGEVSSATALAAPFASAETVATLEEAEARAPLLLPGPSPGSCAEEAGPAARPPEKAAGDVAEGPSPLAGRTGAGAGTSSPLPPAAAAGAAGAAAAGAVGGAAFGAGGAAVAAATRVRAAVSDALAACGAGVGSAAPAAEFVALPAPGGEEVGERTGSGERNNGRLPPSRSPLAGAGGAKRVGAAGQGSWDEAVAGPVAGEGAGGLDGADDGAAAGGGGALPRCYGDFSTRVKSALDGADGKDFRGERRGRTADAGPRVRGVSDDGSPGAAAAAAAAATLPSGVLKVEMRPGGAAGGSASRGGSSAAAGGAAGGGASRTFLLFPRRPPPPSNRAGSHATCARLFDGLLSKNSHEMVLTEPGFYGVRLRNTNESAWDGLYLGIGKMKAVVSFALSPLREDELQCCVAGYKAGGRNAAAATAAAAGGGGPGDSGGLAGSAGVGTSADSRSRRRGSAAARRSTSAFFAGERPLQPEGAPYVRTPAEAAVRPPRVPHPPPRRTGTADDGDDEGDIADAVSPLRAADVARDALDALDALLLGTTVGRAAAAGGGSGVDSRSVATAGGGAAGFAAAGIAGDGCASRSCSGSCGGRGLTGAGRRSCGSFTSREVSDAGEKRGLAATGAALSPSPYPAADPRAAGRVAGGGPAGASIPSVSTERSCERDSGVRAVPNSARPGAEHTPPASAPSSPCSSRCAPSDFSSGGGRNGGVSTPGCRSEGSRSGGGGGHGGAECTMRLQPCGEVVCRAQQERVVYFYAAAPFQLLTLKAFSALSLGMRVRCSYEIVYCGRPLRNPGAVADPFSLRRPRILTLDGGGVLGISSLKVLERLELELQRRLRNPAARLLDCFDLVAGTSTGGIIALGLLTGVSLKEMIRIWGDVSSKIFEGGGRSLFSGIFFDGYDISKLRAALSEALGERFLASFNAPPYCFVTATDVKHNPYQLFLLRNYSQYHLTNQEYRGGSTLPCWAAAWATASAPTFLRGPTAEELEKMGIRVDPEVQLCDGALKANNPSIVALNEAARLAGKTLRPFVEEDLDLLLSVGTGQPSVRQTAAQSAGAASTIQILLNSAHLLTNATAVHRDVLRWMAGIEHRYFRFNVPGIGDIALDSIDKNSFDIILKATNDYLTDEKYFDIKRLVDILAEDYQPRGSVGAGDGV